MMNLVDAMYSVFFATALYEYNWLDFMLCEKKVK